MTKVESEELSMDILMEIHKCMECDVLSKHMIRANQLNLEVANHLLDKEPDNLSFDFQKAAKDVRNIDKIKQDYLFKKFERFDVYESAYENLSIEYDFPSALNDDCKMYLNYAAYIYLVGSSKVWMKRSFPAFEEKLEKLIKAADRFEYSLKLFDDCDAEYDQLFDGYGFKQKLNETKANLDEIKTLKEKFRASTLGKHARLDDHRPIGNPGLHAFIKLIWIFWHDMIGRTIEQKFDGINGRKQFLEFLVDCLKPIHPTLVDGHMIDGPVDNALKKFQKNLKSERE